MKTTTFLTLGALAAVAASAPSPDASAQISAGDYNILTFALTLEHLENAFYTSALKKFKKADFANDRLYQDLVRVARDESAHVDKISSVFKATKKAVPGPCQYNFPFNTTSQFLKLASVIEGVGVSAYGGAAPAVISKDVLKSAAAILPIEARHDAILRQAVGVAPFAAAFDVPLTFLQAWSLASQFIVKGSCPKAVTNLGFKAFPNLSLIQKATDTTIKVNSTITLEADIAALKSPKARDIKHRRHEAIHQKREQQQADRVKATYVAFLTVDGAKIVEAQVGNGVVTVKVPEGLMGQTYVVLTTSKTGVTDQTTLAGPAIIEITAKGTIAAADNVGRNLPDSVDGIDVSGGVIISTDLVGGI